MLDTDGSVSLPKTQITDTCSLGTTPNTSHGVVPHVTRCVPAHDVLAIDEGKGLGRGDNLEHRDGRVVFVGIRLVAEVVQGLLNGRATAAEG